MQEIRDLLRSYHLTTRYEAVILTLIFLTLLFDTAKDWLG